jgi:hypothetical protein
VAAGRPADALGVFMPMAISSIGNDLSQPPCIAAGLSVYPRIAGAASGLIALNLPGAFSSASRSR